MKMVRHSGVPIYFLDASTKMSLETDLQNLVKSQSQVHSDALLWLANEVMDWLIIMDNADDSSLPLAPFLPRCSHGHIIITTRDATRQSLAHRSTHSVDALSQDESIQLLLGASHSDDSEINRGYALDIAKELGGLPLALSHAAAYILDNQCLDTYLATYHRSHSQVLRLEFDLPQNYPLSVAAIIQTSFECLPIPAQVLLRLFACLDSSSIPQSLIAKAAERKFCHVARATNPPSMSTVQYANALMITICPNGEWETFELEKLISACRKFSLVNLANQEGEKFYSMHVLVKMYLQADIVKGGRVFH